jgi:hypothetical protein
LYDDEKHAPWNSPDIYRSSIYLFFSDFAKDFTQSTDKLREEKKERASRRATFKCLKGLDYLKKNLKQTRQEMQMMLTSLLFFWTNESKLQAF